MTPPMTTMMVAARRVDLNLNHSPPPAYEEPVRERLKQAMIQHEIVFKNQVRELHRLYWTQKNLMNGFCRQRSDPLSGRVAPAEERKARDVRPSLPMVNSMQMQMRNFDLELPADEFIDDTEEAADAYPEAHSSEYIECAFGTAGHMNLDLSTIEVDGSYGFKEIGDNAATMSHSRDTVSSDLCSARRIRNESGQCGHMPTEKCSHTEHQTGRWQEQNFLHSYVGSKDNCGSLSANFPTEKQQPKCKLLQIDLNLAQGDEPLNDFPNNVETYPSPCTSSSVLDGENFRVSRGNGTEKESIVTVHPGVVSLGSEISREKCADSLPHEPKYSCPSVQASGQSSNVIENSWNYRECIADDNACRSSIRSPEECCKTLVERFSSAYNGETQDSTDGIVFVDFHKSGKGSIDSSVGQPDAHRDFTKNISISSNFMEVEHDCLHASAGSTNLPPNISRGLEEKQTHKEGSEEDTVSSHAIAPDGKQQDEPKESPIGNNINQSAIDTECTSTKKSIEEQAVISNSENSASSRSNSVTPERNSNKQSPNTEASGCICIQDKQCHFDASQSKQDMKQHLDQVAELDHIIITKAAEALLSISSEKDLLTSERLREFECDEGNGQPQSSDSFETLTLKLQEEIRDDQSSFCASQIDNVTGTDVCGVRIRRGRRLRDFQKDILPGIVSLSRHEICEDLYAIKYELRKKRPRKKCKENWFVPVRSRRSRPSTAGKRR